MFRVGQKYIYSTEYANEFLYYCLFIVLFSIQITIYPLLSHPVFIHVFIYFVIKERSQI